MSQFSRELRLRKALEPLKQDAYDFVFLDCPPSLGLLTVNALAAAEELIVPIQCEYYALEGLGQLLRNVRLVQQNVNTGLRLTGIVMTMFDPRTKLSEQVVAEVRRYFGDRVYQTIIPRTVQALRGARVRPADHRLRPAFEGRPELSRPRPGGRLEASPTRAPPDVDESRRRRSRAPEPQPEPSAPASRRRARRTVEETLEAGRTRRAESQRAAGATRRGRARAGRTRRTWLRGPTLDSRPKRTDRPRSPTERGAGRRCRPDLRGAEPDVEASTGRPSGVPQTATEPRAIVEAESPSGEPDRQPRLPRRRGVRPVNMQGSRGSTWGGSL